MPSWMTTRKGWQRHHLIPVSVWDKYFIPQEAGMNVNGATNMTYLPVAQGIDLVNPNSSLHVGSVSYTHLDVYKRQITVQVRKGRRMTGQ